MVMRENLKLWTRGKELLEKLDIWDEVTKIELLEAPSDTINGDVRPLAMTSNSSNGEPEGHPQGAKTSITAAKLLKGGKKSYDPGKKLLDINRSVREKLLRGMRII